MKIKGSYLIKLFLGIVLLFNGVEINAQAIYKRWNTFNINKIATTFSNYGSICEGQFWYGYGHHPAMEYPIGSGNEYGMALGFYIGGTSADGGGANPDGKWYMDMTLAEYKDNWDCEHWDPYGPGPYENDVPLNGIFNFVGVSSRAAMSDDIGSWPDSTNSDGRYGWPKFYPHTNEPVLLNENGWPGWGPDGKQIGHQESFSVAYAVNHVAEVPPERWLKAQMVFRGMAFKGKLYENYIFWQYEITNIGKAPITDCYFGIIMDYAFPWNRLDVPEEVQAFDKERNMAYAYNPSGIGYTEDGRSVSPTAYAGVIFLKTPKKDSGQEAGISKLSWSLDPGSADDGKISHEYYLRNILNEGSPYDSDGDGIDDTSTRDGVQVPYGYSVAGSAGNSSYISSGPITLDPGEKDTLIICTVMGSNLLDLKKNADRAIKLFKSGFEIAEPPIEPKVIAIPGDRKVTLKWGKDSESSPGFEGYRIYRSVDRGATWGDRVITDATGTPIGYVPIAQFDLKDGIVGPSTDPEATWLDLGSDTGMPETDDNGNYVFVDENLINGLTYRYYIAAYNIGTDLIPPVENSPATNPNIEGDNTVEVTPCSPVATSTLDDIKVVPNPYISTNEFETRPNERELHFTHLPGKCVIRIYNIAMEQIAIIYHDNNRSEESWNLRTSSNQEVAPGIYIYHVSSELIPGEKIGKFVVIK